LEQEIRFCQSPDGVRIAYSSVGSGYPIVVAQGWVGHLELDWMGPARGLWERLAERYRIIRYDRRGTGLSDRRVDDFSLAAQTGDLAAVVEVIGEPSVALLGFSAGGPIVIAYAARHLDSVSHLILYGTYASGSYGAVAELAKALNQMIKADWGGLGSLAMADIYIPGATTEQRQTFAMYQQQCATREVALAQAEAIGDFKVKDILKDVSTPSLVIHKRGDKAVPFELGRRLARDLPDSRFVPLDGDSHLIFVGGTTQTIEVIGEFVTTGERVDADRAARAARQAAALLSPRETEVLRLLAAGKSSREIGDELVLTVRTVERHVTNLYRKIGVHNRAQATAFALEQGMTLRP
jgi:pimeloyl-ACP methyl ester carboxylesterase/DNA-binding CsgD family transcriptional regulator